MWLRFSLLAIKAWQRAQVSLCELHCGRVVWRSEVDSAEAGLVFRKRSHTIHLGFGLFLAMPTREDQSSSK